MLKLINAASEKDCLSLLDIDRRFVERNTWTLLTKDVHVLKIRVLSTISLSNKEKYTVVLDVITPTGIASFEIIKNERLTEAMVEISNTSFELASDSNLVAALIKTAKYEIQLALVAEQKQLYIDNQPDISDFILDDEDLMDYDMLDDGMDGM